MLSVGRAVRRLTEVDAMCTYILQHAITGERREIRCPEHELFDVLRTWQMSGFYILDIDE